MMREKQQREGTKVCCLAPNKNGSARLRRGRKIRVLRRRANPGRAPGLPRLFSAVVTALFQRSDSQAHQSQCG